MSWGLGSGGWGSSSGSPVTHLFFPVEWVVPVPRESAEVAWRPGHREDNEMGGVGWWSESWWNRIQWVVLVQPAGRSLPCWQTAGNCHLFCLKTISLD